jgi:hypothetical protein
MLPVCCPLHCRHTHAQQTAAALPAASYMAIQDRTTRSVPHRARQSAAICIAATTASGSSAFACRMGAPMTLSTSLGWGLLRPMRGMVVKPTCRCKLGCASREETHSNHSVGMYSSALCQGPALTHARVGVVAPLIWASERQHLLLRIASTKHQTHSIVLVS